jgi:hypothetical protein
VSSGFSGLLFVFPAFADMLDTPSMNARDGYGEREAPLLSWHQVSSETRLTCVKPGRRTCGVVRE